MNVVRGCKREPEEACGRSYECEEDAVLRVAGLPIGTKSAPAIPINNLASGSGSLFTFSPVSPSSASANSLRILLSQKGIRFSLYTLIQ